MLLFIYSTIDTNNPETRKKQQAGFRGEGSKRWARWSKSQFDATKNSLGNWGRWWRRA
jgi:hypothetical protein